MIFFDKLSHIKTINKLLKKIQLKFIDLNKNLITSHKLILKYVSI